MSRARAKATVERMRRLRPPFRSARTRLLASYLVLLALSTLVSFVALRQLLLVQLDDRIEESLVQETEELRRLAGGRDPATGRPFNGNVRAIFETYLARNVPVEGEALLTFVEGRFFRGAGPGFANVLLQGRFEAGRLAGEPRPTDRGELETRFGPVRYLAVPLRVGRETRGTFIVANFTRGERQEVQAALQTAGLVAGGVLILGSLVAFLLAGRVLAPVREVTQTARAIEETDLTQRIEVHGSGETAELARTFNAMLDRLEAAFASQRSFVSDASHELRTPITIVRGHLELMGDDAQDRRETVELVMDELDRMTRFVEDLLLLAKAERPDFLEPDSIDVRLLADELAAKAGALGAREWRLEAGADGIVLADRQRLTQAILNLAQNAVEHTEEGDAITLGLERDGEELRLSVADTGGGVPPEDRGRIFDRFARGEGRRRSSGAGLGLAIVQAIADAHGGRIELETAAGGGACFVLVVPARAPSPNGGGRTAMARR